MRTAVFRIGMAVALVLFACVTSRVTAQSSAQSSSVAAPKYPILGSCSQDPLIFGVTDEDRARFPAEFTVTDIWASVFHEIVGGVVESYRRPEEREYDCLDPSASGVVEAPETLRRLAVQLPPWRDETNLAELSRADLAPVVLEYLRTYECALREREEFLWAQVSDDFSQVIEGKADTISDVARAVYAERQKIQNERATARRSVERTLTTLSALERFSGFDTELTCMQRASVDVRNSFALAAEAASCLPRVWNAKDPLRDVVSR